MSLSVRLLPLPLMQVQLRLSVWKGPLGVPLFALCRRVSVVHRLFRPRETDYLPLPMMMTSFALRCVMLLRFLKVRFLESDLLLTMVMMLQCLLVRLWVCVRFVVRSMDADARFTEKRLRLSLMGSVKFESAFTCAGLRQPYVWFASTPRVQARREMLKMSPLIGEWNMWRSVIASLMTLRPGFIRLFIPVESVTTVL